MGVIFNVLKEFSYLKTMYVIVSIQCCLILSLLYTFNLISNYLFMPFLIFVTNSPLYSNCLSVQQCNIFADFQFFNLHNSFGQQHIHAVEIGCYLVFERVYAGFSAKCGKMSCARQMLHKVNDYSTIFC